MELCYQQKWSIIGTKPVVLWLTAVGALTPLMLLNLLLINLFIAVVCLFFAGLLLLLLLFFLFPLLFVAAQFQASTS